jgi:homoserine kinase type II
MKTTAPSASSVARALTRAYGLAVAELGPAQAGTDTRNYLATTAGGEQWFVKIHPGAARAAMVRQAVALARFAARGGVPVPKLLRTRQGDLVAQQDGPVISAWAYLADATTAEAGLHGAQWQAVGTAVGRLHRRLADHPAAQPVLRPGHQVCDLVRARRRLDETLDAYRRKVWMNPFEEWAHDALEQRRALLPRIADLLKHLPDLTCQVVHGDLTAPNLLMRGREVAALIDFLPPTPRFAAWEIARIALDPRTVLREGDWLTGLGQLIAAYRTEHRAARTEDLLYAPRAGVAYTLTSLYPLASPLHAPHTVDLTLQTYGRARHEAALMVLARLEETEETLRALLR